LIDLISNAQEARLLSSSQTIEKAKFLWTLLHGLAVLIIGGKMPLQVGTDQTKTNSSSYEELHLEMRKTVLSFMKISFEGLSH
jgi:hypothetical protein